MQNIIKQVRESEFIKHNLIFFAGSMAIGALNYLYYPVLGRLLSPSTFGEVQTLFSIFAQIIVFLGVLGLVAVNIVVNYHNSEKGNKVILELEKLAIGLSLLVLLAALIGSEFLKQFFKFSSAIPFIILALALVVSVPLTFRNAYLRGRQRFGLVSGVGVISAAGDLIFSIILVLGHLGTTGAIAGLVIAQIFAFSFAAIAARRIGFFEHLGQDLFKFPDLGLIMPELKFALLVFLGSLSMTLFASMDVLFVKHYFDAQTAGLYAGISTVGRIIFFLTASIATVLMSAVKLTNDSNQNQQVLLRSLVLLFLIGGLAWAIFALAPRFIIRILMGNKYLPYANLLPRLSLVFLVVSILNLLISYYMALRRNLIAVIVIIGISATLILVFLYHGSLVAVINSLLYGSLFFLVLLSVWMTVSNAKRNIQA